jgi:hypothetical protein
MTKQLLGFFGFTLALVLVAAVMNVTAQPDANVLQVQFTQEAEARLQQMEGDIAFLMRAFEKAGLIEERK